VTHSFHLGEEVRDALTQIGSHVSDGWQKLKSKGIFGSSSSLRGQGCEVGCGLDGYR